MVLPRSRRGWANSISPGSKIVMSLRADNHFPDHCPRCGAALNNGPGSLLVKWFVTRYRRVYIKEANTHSTTIGCWTAFQETGDAIANFLENGSGLESLDCFSNRITKTQEMDLTPFTRIHFYSLYYNPETSYCPKCFLGLFKLARFLTKEKGFDSFIRDQMACPDL